MFDFKSISQKASTSKFWLWVLNRGLGYTIPFNIPHQLEIVKISTTNIATRLPLIRKNKNHLGGMHACALATIGEFTGGALIVGLLDPTKYRLILKSLKMEYYYQAKTNVHASFTITEEEFEAGIITPLTLHQSILYPIEICVYDDHQKHICTAFTVWQLKSWANTNMKIIT